MISERVSEKNFFEECIIVPKFPQSPQNHMRFSKSVRVILDKERREKDGTYYDVGSLQYCFD